MSDLVIVSKQEIDKLKVHDSLGEHVVILGDLRALLDKSTPVSSEVIARVQVDGDVEWRPDLPDLPVGAPLYTTPQPTPEGYALVPIEPSEEWIQKTCLRKSNTKCSTYAEWEKSHEFSHSTTVVKFRELVIADYKAMITEAMKGQ